jgi:hypothetical protein
MASSTQRGNGLSLTLDAMAEAKRLPPDFLRRLGLRDRPGGGVSIPYYDRSGEEIGVKARMALAAKDGSFWPKGQPLTAYGQWKLHEAEKAGFLTLVEGESDCWALWHHGVPALGIPGANAGKTLEREHIESVETIYIHREPDNGGENFVAGIRDRLAALGFKGKVFELRMADGIKDPADLQTADPERFKACMEEAIRTATPLKPREQEPSSAGRLDEADASGLAEAGAEMQLEYLPLLGQEGYLVRGWSHLLAGYPRSGKTELGTACCRDWLAKGERILYLTEEPRAIWQHRLARAGAAAWAGMRLVFGLGANPLDLLTRAKSGDESVVVVDALRNLGLIGADENDNAALARQLTPWVAAAREKGKTLILLHHDRKGGGQHGEAIAGGHALLGVVDIALELIRDAAPSRRLVRAYARIIQPAELIYEREPDGTMRALGSPCDVDRRSRLQMVRDLLPGEAPGKTSEELLADWPSEAPKPSKRTAAEDLKHGAEAGQWSMSGAGKKGDPFRFWSNGNSIRTPIGPMPARNESNGQAKDRVEALWEKGTRGARAAEERATEEGEI